MCLWDGIDTRIGINKKFQCLGMTLRRLRNIIMFLRTMQDHHNTQGKIKTIL